MAPRIYRNGVDPEFEINGPFTIIRDSIITINTPELPVPVETFSLRLTATIVGENPDFVVIQTNSRVVVEIVEPTGKLHCNLLGNFFFQIYVQASLALMVECALVIAKSLVALVLLLTLG